jgi:hypothetical protein
MKPAIKRVFFWLNIRKYGNLPSQLTEGLMMSRYEDLRVSLEKRNTEISRYWDDMREAALAICASFESFLELPEQTFKNETFSEERYVTLGTYASGKFAGANPARFLQNGNALEFAISLKVLTSYREQAEIVVPMRVSRKGSEYSLFLINPGMGLVATYQNFEEFAQGIFEEIQRVINIRP